MSDLHDNPEPDQGAQTRPRQSTLILRRIVGHLRNQEWTTVLIELMIVILGVFLGLQVTNWNAQRAEQKRADDLFQRLVTDLDNERAGIGAAELYYRTTAAYARTALQGFESPGDVSPEAFVVAAYQASQILWPVTSRSTFNEMVATGAISLIRDAEARNRVVGYYEFDWTQGATFADVVPYRETVRRILPYEIQEMIRKNCGDTEEATARTVIARLPPTCDIDATDAQLDRAAAALRADPRIEADLRYQLAVSEVRISASVSIKDQLDDVIASTDGPAT